MSAGILSSHRSKPPFGLQAGAPGSLGVNRLIRADGSIEQLPGCAEVQVEPGDAIEIETPGGGGYGPSPTGTVGTILFPWTNQFASAE